MNPFDIINKYYQEGTELYDILVNHSSDVTRKALEISAMHPELNIDTEFVREAGMLHDIGIFKTNAPTIACYGEYPYISHGVLGAEILLQEGLTKHALVCERHTGTGLSIEDIVNRKLPLPLRDMRPKTIDEKVICFADCFFSKTHLEKEKTVDEIHFKMLKFGNMQVQQFDDWCQIFLS